MQDELFELKQSWKKEQSVARDSKSADWSNQAVAKRNASLFSQYITIVILSCTALLIYLFLIKWYPYSTVYGKTGVWLMFATLLVRILIEVFSIRKAHRIQTWLSAEAYTKATIRYRSFRKFIHGPVTISVVGIYLVGFYLLMPEFSRHAPLWLTILCCVSVPPGAFIMIQQIRKGIKKEMLILQDWIQLNSILDSKE
ncbi:MAG: hypothetical protein JNK20_15730 [Flavipsychrobacter sp.]|jgi:hypothetical protein|nr:hypothetical protein [Flavipsychrobacter sp.]